MKNRLVFTLVLFIITLSFSYAQENYWKFESEPSVLKRSTPRLIIPQTYRTISLAFDQYKKYLNTAPRESLSGADKALEISLPYPDNSFRKFKIVESTIMEDALAAQFPQIKTYYGQGVDDPTATLRIDYTTQGFHAVVFSPAGSLYIDPYQKENNDLYITYFSKDYLDNNKEKFRCGLDDSFDRNAGSSVLTAPLTGTCIGNQLKTYRVAISCTGEYAVAVCPPGNVTVANTMSAIVTTMNRVNGIYQTELAIRLVLVGANASIVYTNPATDPYTGNNNADTLIVQSQSNITAVLGSSAFDIGHTFSTGGGGLASVGVACSNANKAKGITGAQEPKNDAYDIDYVAHEIGHQVGALHSFEGVISDCQGNRSKFSAYEPGSGTTIMAYPGICGSDNIQLNADPYFHTKSFDEIVTYTTTGNGSTCPVVTNTGNTPPVVVMPVSDIKIPKGTPFILTGSATDINGDALTYSWEEWDLSNLNSGSEWNEGANSTGAPLFRARIPKTSGSRTFPDLAVIIANYPPAPNATDGFKGETLPQVARDMKFRLVARDNRVSGGGVSTGGDGCSSVAPFKVIVTDDGPFRITSPNTKVEWAGGSTHTVVWNVANTDSVAGINVQNVDILMSTDGGLTYPTIIEANTPNDGTQSITVPNIPTNENVRFMIRAVGNIFFDISNNNFTITFSDVLPISLLQFAAAPAGNVILLNWSTATEANNTGFEILRSEGNNNNFLKIGFIPGAGNSAIRQNYTFTDNSVKNGVAYFYRLRQLDLNNTAVYSEIKTARINLEGILSVALQPQPFYNTADLYLNGLAKQNFTIVIRDIAGRTIKTKQVQNSEVNRVIPVDLSGHASGIYVIKILQNNFETTLKAMKR